MTNTELKALRRLFFLDVAEAAQFIGNCHVRSWQRWEQGTRAIPGDVVKMMNLLIEERQGDPRQKSGQKLPL
jgi:DNA-binding transcriptional regulator YiaG